MNISNIKEQIADNEREVAELLNTTLNGVRKMRWWFTGASHNARVSIPAAAKREMRARHRAEVEALREKHRAEIEALDPSRLIDEHIAVEINVDVAMVPDLMRGFKAMDDFERDLWAQYRKE